MKKLIIALVETIQEKVIDATNGRIGTKLESRFIFHGPPIEILEGVFGVLAKNGGIRLKTANSNEEYILPVLLQLPEGGVHIRNPEIGASGQCDEQHLLHVRNDPNQSSFVALVPPGQHSNMSVASTTEEFGLSTSSNTGHATFEEWWEDGFVQYLVSKGLKDAGIVDEEIDDARQIIKRSAASIDEMDHDEGSRRATWRLLSRIYSIQDQTTGLSAGSALALACGIPPMDDGRADSKVQLGTLAQVAGEMADGFKTGIDRLSSTAAEGVKSALGDFLAHVQRTCEVPTAFERSTEAFYLTSDALELASPPIWWSTLTTGRWQELLIDQQDEATAEISILCSNSILPLARGIPAVVKDTVELAILVGSPDPSQSVEVLLTGGSFGRNSPSSHRVKKNAVVVDTPPTSGHKSPITYKAATEGSKGASTRVISLASWIPGIFVACRIAAKLVPPKKPRKGSSGIDWETSLALPGSGRYEILIFTSPDAIILSANGIHDDATESQDQGRERLVVHEIRSGEHQVEIEADGRYQIELSFRLSGRAKPDVCMVYLTCEETKEEGCRSEFERLIKLNRRHLEKFDSKAVVQLDRHARLSSLQTWILDEQNISSSFMPLVISDDYATHWVPPDWGVRNGPILSQAQFLHDPRPETSLFNPPAGFVEARARIAELVRNTSDKSGLMESAQLGKWLARDAEFRSLVETYLDCYSAWLSSDRDIACWVDVIAVCSRQAGGRTLDRTPDAIILSPLHPVRLAWHCLAQQVLFEEVEGVNPRPCPAASILDPDCVPDLLTMSIQSPGGMQGIDKCDYLSVECNSDYWSVLWNGSRLGQLSSKSREAPFDSAFGLVLGGISSGFSPAQVARALEDVSEILTAKPIISLVVASAGGATDACNEGLINWSTRRFGIGDGSNSLNIVGPRMLEVYDTRPAGSRPDQAAIANLSEDTGNQVRWYERQPIGTNPDIGIIAQLDSAQAQSTDVGMRSPMGTGGLIRHRVRRQLHGAFLSESRQALPVSPSGDVFADKLSNCIVALEGGRDSKIGLQFAPDVHAVTSMLMDKQAGFVAVSSSAIDPACFLGGWIKGTYLWDYDLPAYSQRAGDTSGYYLLSQVRDADRDALRKVLQSLSLPGLPLVEAEVEEVLLEVARRGIPTVRGLSGDDTGATGDLGLFLAVRLLQDQFRLSGNVDSLLPVIAGTATDATIVLIIPVDPFRGYLADLARSVGKDRKDATLLRPDLLVIGVRITDGKVMLHLTPVEVKCRQTSVFNQTDAKDALLQAKALSDLFGSLQDLAKDSLAWRLAFQHLLLSMIGFGLRVYSQQEMVLKQSEQWAKYHETITEAILNPLAKISTDKVGRLIVVDGSKQSEPKDNDGDGFHESITISALDAGRIVKGDADIFYKAVRANVGDWGLVPVLDEISASLPKLIVSSTEPFQIIGQNHNSLLPDTALLVQDAKVDPVVEADVFITPDPQGGGINLSIGRTANGFEPRKLLLNLSDTRLNNLNIGVVGDLGTGKTQLLKSLIFQIAQAREENRGVKPRFLIFDYKRDYSSEDFVAATGARVVKPKHLPLNLFDTTSIGESVQPWLDRFRFFADVLDKVYSGIGPVQRDKLKGAVRNSYQSAQVMGRQPTIYDIHSEYRLILGDKSDSPMAIIDDLVDMEIFERDLGKTLPFNDFLDGVVVISLDALGQDDRSKNMLVAIMLNMFYENMLRTPKRPYVGSDPQLRVIDSYLLVDEADNIMRYEFDVLRKLLLQGREFGTGVILASQYLRHFKAGGSDYRDPLLSWFIHKVPNVTPAELGALGFTSDLGELSERVKTLPNHHCLFKSYDVMGEVIRGLPFYELQDGIGQLGKT